MLFWQGCLWKMTVWGVRLSTSMAPCLIGKADSWLVHALLDLADCLKGRCGACMHLQHLNGNFDSMILQVSLHILCWGLEKHWEVARASAGCIHSTQAYKQVKSTL